MPRAAPCAADRVRPVEVRGDLQGPRADAAHVQQFASYSHSIVDGGFELMS
jgi:hypothetical protein